MDDELPGKYQTSSPKLLSHATLGHHHQRQESFLVAHKTYTKPFTFVKYVIKLVGATNPIANSKLVKQYAMNNTANQIFRICGKIGLRRN